MPDDALPVFPIVMGLLGGLALFLTGMEQMTNALKAVAGDGMRTLLARLTKNRVAAAITGAFVTAIIQSSSVTTVLVVGFVSAGLMTLAQSVGVIMGANAGTTITAQIVAFKVTKYALALIFTGFLLHSAGKREALRQWGKMVMGLGLIFFGMGLMSDATDPLRTYEPFIDVMKSMTNPALGILAGAVFTGLVQSSSATTGIVIVLASQGFITLPAGIALAFGANIGTCVTALLATLGKPRVATRAAAIHVAFNVLGVLVWIAFIDRLAVFVTDISPSRPELTGTARLAAESPRQIANAHTVFNLANTVLFLPFTVLLAKLVERLLPDRPQVIPERSRAQFLDDAFLETPALARDQARLEVCRYARFVRELAQSTVDAVRSEQPDELDAVVASHRELEPLYTRIVQFLGALAKTDQDEASARAVHALLADVTNVQHVNEIFATNLVALARERRRLGVTKDPQGAALIDELYVTVLETYDDVVQALEAGDVEGARAVVDRKAEVHALVRRTADALARRVDTQDPGSLSRFRIQSQLVELLKRLYYFAKSIGKDIVAQADAARPVEPEIAESTPAAPTPAA